MQNAKLLSAHPNKRPTGAPLLKTFSPPPVSSRRLRPYNPYNPYYWGYLKIRPSGDFSPLGPSKNPILLHDEWVLVNKFVFYRTEVRELRTCVVTVLGYNLINTNLRSRIAQNHIFLHNKNSILINYTLLFLFISLQPELLVLSR